jgi:predicted transcriptional regulator
MREKIELNKIEDNTEREIIKLLSENEKFMMGDILMKLKLSYQRGHEYLNSLLDKEWVSNTEKAPYYTINVDLK